MLLAQDIPAPAGRVVAHQPDHRPVGGALVLLVVGALTPTWPRGALRRGSRSLTAFVAGGLALFQWHTIDDDGPATLLERRARLRPLRPVPRRSRSARRRPGRARHRRLPAPQRLDGPEVYALMLLSPLGGVVMASANDLIVLFLGLETLSLALYVLAAMQPPPRRRARRAGIKYFVLGGFASAFFLYGVALHLRRHAVDQLHEIVDVVQTHGARSTGKDALVLAGIALLIVGLGFKVAAVPFHFWTPDVYQGAPTPVTAFMASAGKAAAFAADAARARRRAAVHSRRLAPGDLGAGGAVAGRRGGAGGRADRRQAHAGVLVDQPRRVHPRRRRGRRPPGRRAVPGQRDAERRRRTCCCTRCSPSARSRSSPGRPPERWRHVDSTAFSGLAGAAAVAGAGAHGAAARPGRRAADVRASSPSGA